MSYLLRVATQDDLPQILALEHAVEQAPHWKLEHYQAMLSPNHSLVVAEASGEIAGFLAATTIPGLEADIESLVVAVPYRRQGMGAALCHWFFERCGVPEIRLEVRASNHAAQSLYARLGFVEIGVRPSYYRKPEEDAILLKRLKGNA